MSMDSLMSEEVSQIVHLYVGTSALTKWVERSSRTDLEIIYLHRNEHGRGLECLFGCYLHKFGGNYARIKEEEEGWDLITIW